MPRSCHGLLSTDFVADSSSRFVLERGQTDRRDWTPYPTPATIQPARVGLLMYNVPGPRMAGLLILTVVDGKCIGIIQVPTFDCL